MSSKAEELLDMFDLIVFGGTWRFPCPNCDNILECRISSHNVRKVEHEIVCDKCKTQLVVREGRAIAKRGEKSVEIDYLSGRRYDVDISGLSRDFEIAARDALLLVFKSGSLAIVWNLTTKKSQKTSKGCYVASFLYGAESQEVTILRDFRDSTLSKSWIGIRLTDLYYVISPRLVQYFGSLRSFHLVARFFLKCLIVFMIRGRTNTS